MTPGLIGNLHLSGNSGNPNPPARAVDGYATRRRVPAVENRQVSRLQDAPLPWLSLERMTHERPSLSM
jgi:hypothetical protein